MRRSSSCSRQRAEALHPSLGAARPGPARPRLRRRGGAPSAARSRQRATSRSRVALLDQRALAGHRQRLQERGAVDRAGLAVHAGRRARRRDARPPRSPRLAGCCVANAEPDEARSGSRPAGDRGAPGPLYVYGRTRPAVPPLPDADRSRPPGLATCRARPTGARPARRGETDLTGRVSSRRHVRALHRPRRGAVPARRAVAVRRAARAVRDRRVRLGRGVARRGRPARLVPRCPRLPRRPRSRGGRGGRDDRRRWSTSAGRSAVDADHGGHPAVRRPGRPLRVQPQRRPARLPARCATTYRAQGRIHGRADTEVGARWLEDAWHAGRAGRRTCSARSTTGSAARRTSRSWPRTARRTTTRATARTRSSRSARADRDRLDRDLLARPLAVPVRRAGAPRTGGSCRCARRSRSIATGAPLADA